MSQHGERARPSTTEQRPIRGARGSAAFIVWVLIGLAVLVAAVILVVKAVEGVTGSRPPDISQLSNADLTAINDANCEELQEMTGSTTGQFQAFAQWRHDTFC